MNRPLRLLGQFQLDWARHGGNWISCFSTALAADRLGIQMTGHKYDDTTKPCVEIYTVLEQGSSSQSMTVFVAPLADNTFLVLSRAEDKSISTAVLDAWLDAAEAATRIVRQSGRLHDWTAIIGPPSVGVIESRVGVDCEGLAIDGSIGTLRFTSTGRHLMEFSPSPEQPSFSAGHLSSSVPILVSGSHSGHSWSDASIAAARDLHRACGLLSVAWGFCVTVRESPASLEMGIRRVPERLPWQADSLPPAAADPVIDREIPPWASDAWTILTESRRAADAVASFHEGLRAEPAHPSLALVAYIASVEAVSQMLFRDERCTECKAHRDVAAKFRTTLRLVLDDEKAADLSAAYSPRSHTVHRGRLHGYEQVVGSLRLGIWPQDESHIFRWNSVYRMRSASRDILNLMLRNELPRKQKFVDANS